MPPNAPPPMRCFPPGLPAGPSRFAPSTTAAFCRRFRPPSATAYARCRRPFKRLGPPFCRSWKPRLLRMSTPRRSGPRMSPSDPYPHYIEFRHVYKTFDQPVLVDVSFHVDPGETVAIIGRSGVGKSVTLAHMMGFLKPDEGRVIVAYEDTAGLPEAEWNRIRKKVTMVFQS